VLLYYQLCNITSYIHLAAFFQDNLVTPAPERQNYYCYNCFMALWTLSGTTRVSWYQKGKTNADFTEARDSEWQWQVSSKRDWSGTYLMRDSRSRSVGCWVNQSQYSLRLQPNDYTHSWIHSVTSFITVGIKHYSINAVLFVCIFRMGWHKHRATTCLSCQLYCKLVSCDVFYWQQINLIWFD